MLHSACCIQAAECLRLGPEWLARTREGRTIEHLPVVGRIPARVWIIAARRDLGTKYSQADPLNFR